MISCDEMDRAIDIINEAIGKVEAGKGYEYLNTYMQNGGDYGRTK